MEVASGEYDVDLVKVAGVMKRYKPDQSEAFDPHSVPTIPALQHTKGNLAMKEMSIKKANTRKQLMLKETRVKVNCKMVTISRPYYFHRTYN